MNHGTVNSYVNYGCRCDECKTAGAVYRKAWMERVKGSPDTPHGTLNGYCNYSCRCDECRAAMAAYHRQRYHKARCIAALLDGGAE